LDLDFEGLKVKQKHSIENRDIELDSFIKNPQQNIVLILAAHYLFTQRKTSAFAGNTNLKMI
jgi:hypothetical protein